jgi:hypothetical protein
MVLFDSTDDGNEEGGLDSAYIESHENLPFVIIHENCAFHHLADTELGQALLQVGKWIT